jgi:hypothetical protein
VHVHFESVQRVDGLRYVVSVLFQSAFDPAPRATLVLSNVISKRVIETRDVPSLAGGRVVRLRFPVKLERDEEPVLGLVLQGGAPRGRRVRTAWKLDSQHVPPMRGPLLAGTCAPLSEALLELLWRPGQRVPEKPAPQRSTISEPPPARSRLRRCTQCPFEGDAREWERATMCPECGAVWL